MWGEIFNKAENLIRDDLNNYLLNHLDLIYAKGVEWSDLMQDNLVQVMREFAFKFDRIPFFLVKLNLGERVIGLGDIPLVSQSEWITWKMSVNQAINIADKSLDVVRKDGKREVYRISSAVFSDMQNVLPQHFVMVMRDMLNSDWVIYYDEDSSQIVLMLKDDKVTIVDGSLFNIEKGVYVAEEYFNPGFILDGNLMIGVGAQSPASRAQMKDLVIIWLSIKRMRSEVGILASGRDLSVMIGGLWTANDSEISIGAGDLLKMLYLSSINIPVTVEVQGPGESLVEVNKLILDNLSVK